MLDKLFSILVRLFWITAYGALVVGISLVCSAEMCKGIALSLAFVWVFSSGDFVFTKGRAWTLLVGTLIFFLLGLWLPSFLVGLTVAFSFIVGFVVEAAMVLRASKANDCEEIIIYREVPGFQD